MEPTVSVVTIFLNAKLFIEEAVRSVLGQTYRNWELLLVDDGSSDGTTKLARAYADRNPGRIRYLSHEGRQNRGMSASRNLGVRHATGKYVLMLDADDTLAPETLAEQVEILETNPNVAMVYGPAEWWYSWSASEEAQADFIKEVGFVPDRVVEPPELLEKMLRNEGHKPCGGLVRKDLFEQVGGYEEQFRGMYEDQAFLAKVMLTSHIFVSSQCWYRYRKHPESCCLVTVRTGRYKESRTEFLQWLDRYLEGERTEGAALRQTVAQELWKIRHPRLARWRYSAWKWARKSEYLVGLRRGRTVAKLRATLARKPFVPPAGNVDFGDLRRLEPFSRKWGFERGTPIDRVYIERFLGEHSRDITGRVLEIGDNAYTRQFGRERVSHSDVLSAKPGPGVTLVADLSTAAGLPHDAFDCILLTQTLQLIYDVRAAVCHLHRMLKPGGVLLATVPGISPVPHRDGTTWAKQWYWSFTAPSVARLFGEFFKPDRLTIRARGNVFTAAAFLYGLSREDLGAQDFQADDGDYPMLLTVRAVREAE